MFSLPVVDYFFRWRWWAALVAFLPACLLLLVYAKLGPMAAWLTLIPSFLSGALSWTLFEYVMHRFLFHAIGHAPSLKHLHYVVHGMHHAYPTDPTRVIFPPFASVIVGSGLGGLIYLLLPTTWSIGFFAGFVAGYLGYEFIHYASHHIKWKWAWLKRLKRHHLLHHHSMGSKNKNFGVTTTFWDRVFNTYLV